MLVELGDKLVQHARRASELSDQTGTRLVGMARNTQSVNSVSRAVESDALSSRWAMPVRVDSIHIWRQRRDLKLFLLYCE